MRRPAESPASEDVATPTLTAAGYLNIDVTAYVPGLPHKDQRITGATIERALGGMSANLACAAARLGTPWAVRSELISTVGNDLDSQWAIAQLAERGVRTEWLVQPPDGKVTYCLIMVEPEGHRAIISEPMRFYDEQVARRIEQQPAGPGRRLLHTEGYRVPSILGHVDRARQLGWRTSVDLDGLPTGWQNPEGLAKLLARFDVVFINRGIAGVVWPRAAASGDWLQYVGANLEAAAQHAAPAQSTSAAEAGEQGGVLFTLGEEGVLLVPRGNSPVRIPGTRVETVDTTGAGDIFAGVLLAIWLNGEPLQAAARYASIAAALSTTGRGAQGYLPTAADVLAFASSAHGQDAIAAARESPTTLGKA